MDNIIFFEYLNNDKMKVLTNKETFDMKLNPNTRKLNLIVNRIMYTKTFAKETQIHDTLHYNMLRNIAHQVNRLRTDQST